MLRFSVIVCLASFISAVLPANAQDCGVPQLSRAIDAALEKEGEVIKRLHRAHQLNDAGAGIKGNGCHEGMTTDDYVQKLKQQLADIDRVWRAILSANNDLKKVEHFTKVYLVDANWILGNLDDFYDFVKDREPFICNLLCRAHILPAFRLSGGIGTEAEEQSVFVAAFDLPRYLHTATCFGFVPDPSAAVELVRRFENILSATLPISDWKKLGTERTRLVSAASFHYMRYDMHDVVENQQPVVGSPGKYPKLHEMRQALIGTDQGRFPPGKTGDYRYRPIEPTVRAAAAEACHVARGPGRLRLMERNP